MLGSEQDKRQEGQFNETTELTLNIDQAVILYRAMISLSVDIKTRKESLTVRKNERKQMGRTLGEDREILSEINEELQLIKFTESKIPDLVDNIKEAIVYLQKEDDAIIKGVQFDQD